MILEPLMDEPFYHQKEMKLYKSLEKSIASKNSVMIHLLLQTTKLEVDLMHLMENEPNTKKSNNGNIDSNLLFMQYSLSSLQDGECTNPKNMNSSS